MIHRPAALKALSLLAALSLAGATPALAGPAEAAFLAKYEGNWRGTGKVTGDNPGTVVCRLSFKSAAAARLTYTGRCSFGGGAASFRGTIAYNDAQKRYEATTSSTGVRGSSVGKKQGNSVVFATSGTQTRMGTVSSTMTLGGNSINLQFKLVDDGDTTASNISFRKG